jgi:hypothetical protein
MPNITISPIKRNFVRVRRWVQSLEPNSEFCKIWVLEKTIRWHGKYYRSED